ncbi:MAG: ATP-grasp domain-containing protein [Cyanosarcina radialis HA8281-LM2]|nr:ATP-grasp domain-containing protein [Cyanosarcina radialis HA8281-LM2]
MRFIFPSDYFNPKQADAAYIEQMTCLQNAGFATSVISIESLGSGLAKIIPVPDRDLPVVYRGWMLSPADYELLVRLVESTEARVLTSPTKYLAAHYLPNWYPLIADLTPETKFYAIDDDLESALNGLNWQGFFIKDYVKSLKTSVGSTIYNPSEISTVVSEMQKFRGHIEGGICVRRLEDFASETERRYFVIRDRAFAASPDDRVPDIVTECAQRIKSQFFSVDAIELKDGTKRIVEIGDGQVSDLVRWTAERFARIWLP